MKTQIMPNFELREPLPGRWATSLAAAFLVLHLPWALRGGPQENSAERSSFEGRRSSASTCQVFGHLFGMNRMADKGQMLVKRASGEIEAVLFDPATAFARVSTTTGQDAVPDQITPDRLHVGDWICAQVVRTDGKQRTVKVLIAPRPEIGEQQKIALADWLRSSVFGAVVQVEPEAKTLVLEYDASPGARRQIHVNASDPTRIRRFLPEATNLRDAEPGSWEQIRVGDRAFVRGEPNSDQGYLRARLIVLGDFQALAGTIQSIKPLEETVGLRELHTGEAITVHIPPTALFLTIPAFETAQQPSNKLAAGKLRTIVFGDLQVGDSVLVLGRNRSPKPMSGLALIAGFGWFDQLPGGQIAWSQGVMTSGIP
jgi:hypothetical protein